MEYDLSKVTEVWVIEKSDKELPSKIAEIFFVILNGMIRLPAAAHAGVMKGNLMNGHAPGKSTLGTRSVFFEKSKVSEVEGDNGRNWQKNK